MSDGVGKFRDLQYRDKLRNIDWKRPVAWLSEENDSVKVVDGTLVEEHKWVVLSLRKGVANLTI